MQRLMPGMPEQKKAPQFDPKLPPIQADKGAIPIAHVETPTGDTAKQNRPNTRVLRIFSGIIAIGAAIVSLYNTYEWFAALRPAVIAALMALSMVGASVLLPDFSIVLFKNKNKTIGSLIFLVGVIATVFCMVTTMAAIYNGHTWSASKIEEVSASEEAIQDAKSERDRIISDIEMDKSSISDTQAKIAQLDARETISGGAQILQRRLEKFQDKLANDSRRLSETQVRLDASRGEQAKNSGAGRDFYTFISSVIGGKPSSVEFFASIIPAVFLELVAPIMVAVAFFI